MKIIISNIKVNMAIKLIGCLLAITDTGMEEVQIEDKAPIKKITKRIKPKINKEK